MQKTANAQTLPDFIRENMEKILVEWEGYAITVAPVSGHMTKPALRDHAKQILEFIADDIESSQTSVESKEKSRGKDKADKNSAQSAAEIHGEGRLKEGFGIIQMVSEYRALRASVVRLWIKGRPAVSAADLTDLTRFNEAIDQALAESVAFYTEEVNRSKDLFLGILGHDIRNPLGAISMSAQLLSRNPALDARQSILTDQIRDSVSRIDEIIAHLIDLTRTKLGSGIVANRAEMNIGDLANRLVDETRSHHPEGEIRLSLAGNLDGQWDDSRLGQVLSNLLGNAVQYHAKGSAISLTVTGHPDRVDLAVHNMGTPIAPASMQTLFDSMVRTPESTKADKAGSTNLGLGLFIAREIVVAHGGEIAVTSSANEGTIFTVHLPRFDGGQSRD